MYDDQPLVNYCRINPRSLKKHAWTETCSRQDLWDNLPPWWSFRSVLPRKETTPEIFWRWITSNVAIHELRHQSVKWIIERKRWYREAECGLTLAGDLGKDAKRQRCDDSNEDEALKPTINSAYRWWSFTLKRLSTFIKKRGEEGSQVSHWSYNHTVKGSVVNGF